MEMVISVMTRRTMSTMARHVTWGRATALTVITIMMYSPSVILHKKKKPTAVTGPTM
jgi:hypothetical protein